MTAERVVARIVIERFIGDDGTDLVRVDSDDMTGERIPSSRRWGCCNSRFTTCATFR